MRPCTVGEVFNHRCAEARAGPLGGPLRRRINGEEVVAVDPQGGEAIAQPLQRESRCITGGDALEGRDRPLIVDDIENDRSLIGRGDGQGCVEVAFCRRAVANPAGRDLVLTLVAGGHRPAGGLRELRTEIAGDREEIALGPRIVNRQLATLEVVAAVGNAVAHHVDDVATADKQYALLAVGRENHVAVAKRHGTCDRDGLFAGRLHVEAHLALTLELLHPLVIDAGQNHVAQTFAQHVGFQLRVPFADSLVIVVERADQPQRKRLGFGPSGFNAGAGRLAGGGDLDMREIRRIARTAFWNRNAIAGLRRRHGASQGWLKTRANVS